MYFTDKGNQQKRPNVNRRKTMHMKVKKLILSILVLLISISVITSCKDSDIKEEPGSGTSTLEQRTNKWIYTKMQEVYLWNNRITPKPNLDNKDTKDFFESLLYAYKTRTGDRFSYIEEDLTNSKKSASSNNLGFDILPYYYAIYKSLNNYQINLGFYVVNVRANTDAEKQGLKRGNLIYAIGKDKITFDNYQDMEKYLQELSSVEIHFYNKEGEKKSLKINATDNYDIENPIWLTKVINHNGVKAGYIVYNKFERESSNDEGSYAYDIELVEAIGNFYKQGVTNIVLDLRYNPGGYVTSAVHLASALLPNRSEKGIFAIHHYNSILTKKYQPNEYFTNKIRKGNTTLANIPESKLERLYILATDNSASASELTIVGLKAYLGDKLVHIGTQTVGKDKASIAYTSDDKDIKWTLHPLVSRLTDKDGNGDYIDGLPPTIERNEWQLGYNCVTASNSESKASYKVPVANQWKCDWVELGNPEEILLATALNHIKTGGTISKASAEELGKEIVVSQPAIKRLQAEAMIAEPQEIENNNQN